MDPVFSASIMFYNLSNFTAHLTEIDARVFILSVLIAELAILE